MAVDKKNVKRMQDIDKLDDSTEDKLYFLIDNVGQNSIAKKAFNASTGWSELSTCNFLIPATHRQFLAPALPDLLRTSLREPRILTNTNSGTIKKSRNKIIHSNELSHKVISELSSKQFYLRLGVETDYNLTDKVIDDNLTATKIEREIEKFTKIFLKRTSTLFELLEYKFEITFKEIMEQPRSFARKSK